MRVIIFGATGMVGQGVLRECLASGTVQAVLHVGRTSCQVQHAKLREICHPHLHHLDPIAADLTGYDACFYCLGISVAGLNEAQYTRITYDLTVAAANLLVKLNPQMTFCYVSGASTDSSEKGRVMWARIKGKTENYVLGLPFKASYMFRPGYIQPMGGVVSKTLMYRAVYAVLAPLYPVWKRLFPRLVTTNENIGRAMLAVARTGYAKKHIDSDAINQLAAAASTL